MERLEELKAGKIYLVYDTKNRRMAIEKHLQGKCPIYEQLKALPHPYLPKLYNVSYTENETVILEEYIGGPSIGSVSVGEKQIKRWLFELCNVLEFLHKNNILHRDIKPSNILLGSDGHIRLIDFDAAREEKTSDAANDTRLLGTRGYAPPEQYGFAQTDERADIYALGITFRKLLGESAKKRRWKHILKKCTEIEPKKRYRHVRQIKWAIWFDFIRRKILYPILIVCIMLFTAFVLFMYWGYSTDSGMKDAINMTLFPQRIYVFKSVDMDAIKNSDAELYSYGGNVEPDYRILKEKYPSVYIDGESIDWTLDTYFDFIYTGYTTDEGYPLFGVFLKAYRITDGDEFYASFEGLCYVTEDGNVIKILPKECEPYAPAVLYLYNLKVFSPTII